MIAADRFMVGLSKAIGRPLACDSQVGPPTNYLSSPLFGQSTQMLGASLGSGGQSGGLNPLYQIGGPRSAQVALKILF